VQSYPGQSAGDPIFRLDRNPTSSMFKVHPTNGSIVMTNQESVDVISWGFHGAIRIANTTWGMDINGANTNCVAISARVGTTASSAEPNSRWQLRSDGWMSWGSGGTAPDASLFRAGPNVLRTSGIFRADLGLQTMVVNGKPNDSMFPSVQDGMIVLDNRSDKLWIRSGNSWKSVNL
jgi:hypothetical protein